jgi:hypothetical protein
MSLLTGNCTTEDLPSWEDYTDPIDGDRRKNALRLRHQPGW